MIENLKYEGLVHRHESYWDYELGTGNPREFYAVSYDADEDDWFGTRRTSETDDGEFMGDYPMSEEDVAQCVSLILGKDLPFMDE